MLITKNNSKNKNEIIIIIYISMVPPQDLHFKQI